MIFNFCFIVRRIGKIATGLLVSFLGKYDDTNLNYGWEIDHIKPVAKAKKMNWIAFSLFIGRLIEKKTIAG